MWREIMKNVLNHDIPFQKFFEEISRIPHGSFNERAISEYVINFAKKHNLGWDRDKMNNVLIKKPGQNGGEDAEPVLLQSHLDMVCVKVPGSNHNFETDPIPLLLDGDILTADGTTLGADDGTGVASMLALLEDSKTAQPPIEALFTVQEEVGMFGAKAFDYSKIKSRRMIGLDSGGENLSSVNAAGCGTIGITRNFEISTGFCNIITVTVNGLFGGHSGVCIDNERGNGIKIVVAIMRKLYREGVDFKLVQLDGGQASNAIPDACQVVFATTKTEKANEIIEGFSKDLKKLYEYNEPNLAIKVESKNENVLSISQEDSLDIINMIYIMPHGRHHKSLTIDDFVTVSSNVAIVSLEKGEFSMKVSTRAEDEFKHDIIEDRVLATANSFGFKAEVIERTPSWEYMSDSKMREVAAPLMKKWVGKELEPEFVHGGLECGYFANKIPGIDIFVTGCIGADVHTPKEWCDLASADRIMNFLTGFLEVLAKDKK